MLSHRKLIFCNPQAHSGLWPSKRCNDTRMPAWNTAAIPSQRPTPISASQRKTVKEIWVVRSANLANHQEIRWGSQRWIPGMRTLKISLKGTILTITQLHRNCLCASSSWRSQYSISMIVWMMCRSPWQTNLAEFPHRWQIRALVCEETSLKSPLLKSCKNMICKCLIAD